ncbi:MAG: hypothetical protein IPM18_01190 [Phycisphaerales bacterium]|nr:hypothetical protein [Phycisphaerales bacterium]
MLAVLRRKLAELPHQLRDGLTQAPQRWRDWRTRYREDPGIFWHGPIPRLAGLIILALLAFFLVQWLIDGLAPPGDRNRSATAQTAVLYTICNNPACGVSGQTQQALNFNDWPITCTSCSQKTTYRATRCSDCRRWVAFLNGMPGACPTCRGAHVAPQPNDLPTRTDRRTDDDDDPW